MTRTTLIVLGLTALITAFNPTKTMAQNMNTRKFEISFPAPLDKGPIDGRLLLLISTNSEAEPRFQIHEDLNTQQVFGVDVEAWKAGEVKLVDAGAVCFSCPSVADTLPGPGTGEGGQARK